MTDSLESIQDEQREIAQRTEEIRQEITAIAALSGKKNRRSGQERRSDSDKQSQELATELAQLAKRSAKLSGKRRNIQQIERESKEANG